MKWIIPSHKGVPLIEWLCAQRNILDTRKYFSPSLQDLEDPFVVHDMHKAVDFIVESVKNKKKIFIHGDFDADGITATSIMWIFLSKYLKADVMPYIPSRFYEGYGLTEESISAIKQKGGQVIITVDCGVKDIELVNKYSPEIDFVITDHHTIRSISEKEVEASKIIGEYLISAKAKAVVHPALPQSDFKEICGAMVSFKVCSALNQKLNLGVNMQEFSDLCAIGTVCDVMPLVKENRTIVQLGLGQLNKHNNLGLKALLEISKAKANISAYHLGFVIGPRLNAAGRLGDALDAVRLLTTGSDAFARQMAQKLEDLNLERKRLTEEFIGLAENEIKKDESEKLFIFFGEEWPEGLLGLIAGKLSEKYSKPVIIGSKGKVYKASARSPENFNITQFLSNFEQYLEKYGGHAQAAGLTVKSDSLDLFLQAIRSSASKLDTEIFEKNLYIDAVAQSLSELNLDNAEKILSLEPFGNKCPKPVIYVNNLKIKRYTYMGQNNEHIKIYFADKFDNVVEALSFGDAKRFEGLLNYPTLPIELAVNLEVDEWNGFKKPSLRIIDFRVQQD